MKHFPNHHWSDSDMEFSFQIVGFISNITQNPPLDQHTKRKCMFFACKQGYQKKLFSQLVLALYAYLSSPMSRLIGKVQFFILDSSLWQKESFLQAYFVLLDFRYGKMSASKLSEQLDDVFKQGKVRGGATDFSFHLFMVSLHSLQLMWLHLLQFYQLVHFPQWLIIFDTWAVWWTLE